MKKFLSVFLAIVLLCCICPFNLSANAVEHLGCVKQTEAKWKQYTYGTGTLYSTGCGIFSLVNAVGYLTGQRMDVTSVASWAHSIDAYNVTGAEGTYRAVLYPKVEKKYGATYGFTVDCGSKNGGYWAGSSSTTLKNHLAGGGVAIGHVPGHFIAIVGYNFGNNKFHVYDSAPSSSRGTNSNGGDVWVTQSALATGKLKMDWFCLLSATGKTDTSYTYSFSFNANGGTLGNAGAFTVRYGQDFQILNTTCTRSGYTWAGWHVKRNNDNKWYVAGQGWCTESQISSNGYTKKVYSNYQNCNFDDSWIKGISGNCSYTFYAVWVQSRDTRIKLFVSPYGRGYDHLTAMNSAKTNGFTQEYFYAWYIL